MGELLVCLGEGPYSGIFDVLYQVFARFALLMVWLLALRLFSCCQRCGTDGLMTWRSEETTFDFSEPYHPTATGAHD